MKCKVCWEKAEEIRDILRPFGLHLIEPVAGVRILAEEFLKAREFMFMYKDLCK